MVANAHHLASRELSVTLTIDLPSINIKNYCNVMWKENPAYWTINLLENIVIPVNNAIYSLHLRIPTSEKLLFP